MIEVIENITINKKIDRLVPDGSIFMDIETTGFSRVNNRIYMIGWLVKQNNIYTLYQYMTEDPSEEKDLILTFMRSIADMGHLYTFNGKSFDIPFINSRGDKYGLPDVANITSIDMYRQIKNREHLLDLPNLRLNTLERYLGIYREDKYDGGELIDKYLEYEKNKSSYLLDLLLLHNREDIVHMPHILQYKELLDSKSTVKVKDETFIVQDIRVNNSLSIIKGTSSISKGYFNYGPHEIIINDGKFKMTSKVLSGKYDQETMCLYITKDNLNLVSQISSPSPEPILLLKIGSDVAYKNLYHLLHVVLDTLL